jgi:hypothetical protein
MEHARKLDGDHTATDAYQTVGNLPHGQRLGAEDDILAIDAGEWWAHRLGASRQYQLAGRQLLGRAVLHPHAHLGRRQRLGGSLEDSHFVRFEQLPNAAGELLDHLVLEGDRDGHINRRRRLEGDAELVQLL